MHFVALEVLLQSAAVFRISLPTLQSAPCRDSTSALLLTLRSAYPQLMHFRQHRPASYQQVQLRVIQPLVLEIVLSTPGLSAQAVQVEIVVLQQIRRLRT